jgi:hypothetical protein
MINPFHEINWKPGKPELRKFALSLIIGFPCIALIFFTLAALRQHALPAPHGYLQLAGIGAAAGLVSLLVPLLARPLYYVWYAVTACIGLVMSNLIIAIIYYGLFTPLGLVMRLFGRDALALKTPTTKPASYWKDAPPAGPAASYFSQY